MNENRRLEIRCGLPEGSIKGTLFDAIQFRLLEQRVKDLELSLKLLKMNEGKINVVIHDERLK